MCRGISYTGLIVYCRYWYWCIC